MADRIGTVKWDEFRALIRDAHDMFNQDDITWKRFVSAISQYNEDNVETYETIELKGLFQYNYYQTWPSSVTTTEGEIDRQNNALILNKDYLRENGWLDANDMLIFNPEMDRFIHRGITWKSHGWTDLSQAQDRPLLLMIILDREEKESPGIYSEILGNDNELTLNWNFGDNDNSMIYTIIPGIAGTLVGPEVLVSNVDSISAFQIDTGGGFNPVVYPQTIAIGDILQLEIVKTIVDQPAKVSITGTYA